jgi:hypothetical protein
MALRGLAWLLLAPLAYGCANIAGIQRADTSPEKQHCIDGMKDFDEEDIDCGGKDCLACAGADCTADAECQTGGCTGGKCRAASCTDGIFDGYESSVDCGDPRGVTVGCPLCVDGNHCFNGCNCASAYCDPTTNLCQESPSLAPNCDHCSDGVKEPAETDVDCGGGMSSGCQPCKTGHRCMIASDCASNACLNGVCG